jgi:hypothetical protein
VKALREVQISGYDFRYMEEKINKVHQDEDFIYPSLGWFLKFKNQFSDDRYIVQFIKAGFACQV